MPDLKKKERDVLLSFAARVDRNDSGAMNNLGVLYFRKGMYEEAIEQFKEALKLNNRFDLARENLQYLYADTKMEDPDVKRWKKEVEKNPDNLDALIKLGVSYQNMGRFEEAATTLGAAIEKNSDHFLARIHLGSVLKAQGLYQQALEHYIAASGDIGKSAVFHTDLGEIYYNLGRTEEAVSSLRTAIKLDADYWRSHFLLSFAYGDNGNLQDALEESRIASRLNPSFLNTEANLAISDYGADGSDEGSGGMSKEVPSLESTSFTLGVAYRERGYMKEALKEFSKALDEMPDKDRIYLEIGKIYLSSDEREKALPAILKSLEFNAENSKAYLYLGIISHLNEDFYQAAVGYLQAYRLNSADVDAMNNLGVLLYQVGLTEEAERMFKKGLNLKLYHQELNYNFLNTTIIREELMMAENLIQRLEAFMGKSPYLYEKRALLNYKMNRMTLALFDLESAISLDRNRSDAHYLKGLIFLREEDMQSAIDAVAEGSKIDRVFREYFFHLATEDNLEARHMTVDNKLTCDPDDQLIELLQSGVKREFGKIHDVLMSIMEKGIKSAGGVDVNRGLKTNEGAKGGAPKADDGAKTGDGAKAGENKNIKKQPKDAAEMMLDEALKEETDDVELKLPVDAVVKEKPVVKDGTFVEESAPEATDDEVDLIEELRIELDS